MSSEKRSFVIYHDIRGPVELLSDEERGKLFLALLDYSEFGACPEFDGALQMAFAFIQTALDRDTVAWESKRESRAEAGRAGGIKRAENAKQANQANATFAKQNQANQANQAVPVPVPAPVPVPVRESKADKPPARARGQYGWVKLTDEQYSRLLADLGEAEALRCIAYIDEAAQSTGNKNRWKDWNLVVRKCSREKWGGVERHDRGTHTSIAADGAGKSYNIHYDVE